MIKSINEVLSKIVGLNVEGIHHDYFGNVLTILFGGGIMLLFKDCSLVYDGGIVNQKVTYASEYSGEMGFVLDFRERGLDTDDYYFVLLKGENAPFPKNQIRISFKDLEISTKS